MKLSRIPYRRFPCWTKYSIVKSHLNLSSFYKCRKKKTVKRK